MSVFLRQKRDVEGLADLRPNSGMNTTYQAYFEALLAPDQNQEQHPTDKAAVVKYIRRRERRRRADENRESRQLTEEIVEKVFHTFRSSDHSSFFLLAKIGDLEEGRWN